MTTFEGNTIPDAIEKGLKQLGLAREQVSVQVISEGKKGLLGIGKKPAIVDVKQIEVQPSSIEKPTINTEEEPVKKQVTSQTKEVASSIPKPTPIQSDKAQSEDEVVKNLALYLIDVTDKIGVPAMVRVSRKDELIIFHLDTEKEGLLIGKHGKTINALQYLSQTFVNHRIHSKKTIVLDVGDYRERRASILQRLADNTAREAIATGQPVFLDPMPAFERKQIHAQLTDNPHIKTYSEGTEPHRYLIVEAVKNVL